MLFADRANAAEHLAKRLLEYRGCNPLILAIPRGGLVIGRVLADRLNGELDVVLVRKLRARNSPEVAIGAIDETGWTYLAPDAGQANMSGSYIEAEKQYQLNVLRERRQRHASHNSPISPTDRTVIVVDDGIATGATMIAALHAVRMRKPGKLICAVPVAASDSLEWIQPYADEVVCLQTPSNFHAVGQFYLSFEQVDEESV